MKQQAIVVKLTYPITYVPKGARKPRTQDVTESVPLFLPILDDGDCPTVLTASNPEIGLWGGPKGIARSARRLTEGLGVRAVLADGTPIGLDALSPAREAREPAAWTGTPHPFLPRAGIPDGAVPYHTLNAASIESSGRDRAIASAQSAAMRCALIDGEIHVPVLRPVWRVETCMDAIEVDLIEAPRSYADWGPLFDTGDLSAALDHAHWLRDNPIPGAPVPEDQTIRFNGDVQILRADLLPRWTLPLARGAISPFRTKTWGHDFAQLPPAALQAWATYRGAEPGAMAKNDLAPIQAKVALLALRDLFHALPPDTTRPGGASAREIHTALHETVQWQSAYLMPSKAMPKRDPSPSDTDDAESLAGMTL